MEIQTNNHTSKEEDFVRVSKSEYEAFKSRLNTIETKLHEEFQTVKLNSIKAEMVSKSNFNGPEGVENRYHKTLQEVEKFENSDRKTDILAKRLSRELKIRPCIENPVVRSPSARKIGSLRRKNASNVTRQNSWHVSCNFETASAAPSSLSTESSTFYPQPNLKRLRMLDSSNTAPVNNLPQSVEKVKPEKPARKTAQNSLSAETWTNGTEFFKDNESTGYERQEHEEEVFKTPVRIKRLQVKGKGLVFKLN